jgi:uncharacterized OsmC-like protein
MAKAEQVIQTTVTVEWVDDLTFKLKFDNPKLPELFIDETHESASPEVVGPDPSRLLVSAIMGCLNASFAFCLKKARVPLKAMKAKGILTIKRNEAGFLRVSQIDVELMPEIEIQSGIPRMERCIETFHNYCTITESVRQGIPVNIKINKDKVKTS